MAPKTKGVTEEQKLELLKQDFMRTFPKSLSREFGHLISIWICTYLGTQQEATWDGAARELLSECLHDTGRFSLFELEEERQKRKKADSSTSE